MKTSPSENRTHEVIESIASLTELRDQRSLELCLITSLREMLPKTEGWLLDVQNSASGNAKPTLTHGNTATLPLVVVDRCRALPDADLAALVEERNTAYLMTKLCGSDRERRHLLILAQKTWSDMDRQLAQGMLRVYKNFIDLLYSSEIDTLTGLYNRRKLETTLAALHMPSREERRESGAGRGCYLAIMDLDRFKRINDTFGHLIGDEVLLVLANILRGTLRSGDKTFRYGGEEFVVLFQDTTQAAIEEILERVRHNVEAHDFPLVGNVTLSIGFAGLAGADSPLDALGKADRALYFAKDQGRNQVRGFARLVEEGRLDNQRHDGSIELF